MPVPTYAYCTVAIGKSYLSSALLFHDKVSKYSNHKCSVITTDESSLEGVDLDKISPKIHFDIIEPDYKVFNLPDGYSTDQFNYNVKHRPILKSHQLCKDSDYIIFVDSDWEVTDQYDESGVISVLNLMKTDNIDFLYERPHNIGRGKQPEVSYGCFWSHKIRAYGLLETDAYDAGEVCNEQYMIFANNDKLSIFSANWMELFNKSQAENIWSFAEGVEIGMSTVVANMKTSLIPYRIMDNYYLFKTKYGEHTYLRF
jgi:hypothetical protein